MYLEERTAGIKPQLGLIASNCHLTLGEKESLKRWILLMDQRGMPPSKALDQFVKECKMAMSSAMLLANENEKLCMENQYQKKKRAKKYTYIAKEGILSGAERASQTQVAQIRVVKRAVETAVKRLQYVLRKCSMCSLIEHTAHTCPEWQTTS
jgi:hypothetical protein